MLPFSNEQFLLPCIMSFMHRAQSENVIKLLLFNIFRIQPRDTSLSEVEIIDYSQKWKITIFFRSDKFSFRERLLEYFLITVS